MTCGGDAGVHLRADSFCLPRRKESASLREALRRITVHCVSDIWGALSALEQIRVRCPLNTRGVQASLGQHGSFCRLLSIRRSSGKPAPFVTASSDARPS